MEIVSFKTKERSGLMYKKELGGGVQLFLNGEDYFEMRKRLLDVQKKSQGGARLLLSR